MATSGVTSGLMTVRQAVVMAHEICEAGLLHEGSPTLEPYDEQKTRRHLNWMLKSMQADGLQFFRAEEIALEWPADEAEQELATNYLDIREMRVRDASDQDRQLTRIDLWDYANIPNKFQSGEPNSFSLVQTTPTLVMRLWPVPTAITNLYATGERVIEDITSLDENIDIPQEWAEGIVYKLADRLNTAYGYAGTEGAAVTRARGDLLYSALRVKDEPHSYFLSPGA